MDDAFERVVFRSELTVADRVAFVRFLIERRGVGQKQIDRVWKTAVVANALLGVVVGFIVTMQNPAPELWQRILIFLLAMTVFWTLSGAGIWLLRFARGGKQGDVDRAVRRAERAIRAERDGDGGDDGEWAYEVVIDEGGLVERYRGTERPIGWDGIDGAETFFHDGAVYLAVRTSDGLGVLAPERGLEGEAGVAGVAKMVEARAVG